jgi:putative membrane-bound dehydrogenase-like protein
MTHHRSTWLRCFSISFAITSLLSGLRTAHVCAAEPAGRPLHVLYVGDIRAPGTGTNYALLPGQRLAAEAIYFDHRDSVAAITPAYLKHFDAVVLALGETPLGSEQQRALDEFTKSGRGVQKIGGESKPTDAQLRADLLAAVGEKARAEWQAFIAAREPLKGERRPEVANYERRPEPVPYQFPLSARESMKYTQVPADFELKLFAAEPDIVRPIGMAWDERGRLWIAETRDYPHGLTSTGGNDDIKICEDTDGDGQADKFTVFADKLSIPTSLVFANGGIIVSQAPHFLFLKDTDGDDKADVRQVLFEGCWGTGDTHAGPSSLQWGFDNWLYGAVGYSGFRGTVGGKPLNFSQGVYRFRPDGSAIEFLHQFNNNTWGFGQNAEGDVFGSTANNNPTFFGGLPATHVPLGQRFLTAKSLKPGARMHPNTPNVRQVDAMGGYTAAAGHTFMYSDALPARLQGKALVCEPTCKLVGIFDIRREGAGYAAVDGLNLIASADEWMSPVFADVGPDGAVWVADWYNFIIQHNPTPSVQRGGYQAETGRGGAHVNPIRDNTRGRVYRVVWKEAPPAPIKSLAGASPADLVKALDSGNKFWRLTAQRLLVDGKKTNAIDALKIRVKANDNGVGAIHALWALHGLKALDRETGQAALLAGNAGLRRNAARALGRHEASSQLFFESGLVHDPDLATRLAAFVKLAEFSTSPEIQTVVGKLRREPTNEQDEWLSEAVKLLAKVHQVRGYTEGPNLLPSPGFETFGDDGLPKGWTLRRSQGQPRHSIAKNTDAHSGESALRFEAPRPEVMDIALAADVPVKPNTEYRLAAWLKTDLTGGFGARVGIEGLSAATTPRQAGRTGGWGEGDVVFNSGDRTSVTVQCLVAGRASGVVWFDDVSLAEITYVEEAKASAGDSKRGEQIFLNHPVAGCARCHAIGGQGGVVGPALDGLASRKDEAYILESLMNPNAKLADGFKLAVSPMPPVGLILKEQELADVKAYLLTLKLKK